MSSVRKRAGETRGHMPHGAQAGRFPTEIQPMLATLVDRPFNDDNWLYETKWDGIRALCFSDNGRIRYLSRNSIDITVRYPELSEVRKQVKADSFVLDGEIVAFDDEGRPNFQRLQSRIGLVKSSDIEKMSRKYPVVFYIFDLLYLNGFNLMNVPLIERKRLLESILKTGNHFFYSQHVIGYGDEVYKMAAAAGLEGIVAKRIDSLYVQKRSRDWAKIKLQKRQEVVICGYTDPQGTREHIGALVVGVFNDNRLHYAGSVGGGFSQLSLKQVYTKLKPLSTEKSPFTEKIKLRQKVHWVKPVLVCEVRFTEWTEEGRLRHPIFLGLREDKRPEECVRESPEKVKKKGSR
jgi:bifunctional non-homologous end joining protein LigD